MGAGWVDGGGGGVGGFRRITDVVRDGVSEVEVFRRNVRKFGAAGWPVDLCFLTRQLGLCEALVRACPEVRFVLDHCGTPDIAGGDFAVWRQGMTRLAGLPNLWVKLSGITAYVAPGTGPDAVFGGAALCRGGAGAVRAATDGLGRRLAGGQFGCRSARLDHTVAQLAVWLNVG